MPSECKVCGKLFGVHDDLEHEFSLDGQLKVKEKSKSPNMKRAPSGGPDVILRAFLVREGIIDAAKLLEFEVTHYADAERRAAGPAT